MISPDSLRMMIPSPASDLSTNTAQSKLILESLAPGGFHLASIRGIADHTGESCTSVNSYSNSFALFTVSPTSHTGCLSLSLLRLVQIHQATIEKSTAVLDEHSESTKDTKSPELLKFLVSG